MGEERGGGEEAFVERKSGGGEVSSFNGGFCTTSFSYEMVDDPVTDSFVSWSQEWE